MVINFYFIKNIIYYIYNIFILYLYLKKYKYNININIMENTGNNTNAENNSNNVNTDNNLILLFQKLLQNMDPAT